ncbi:hypothetical protein V8C40DRAFT_251534 [Trichoderma camerunense]
MQGESSDLFGSSTRHISCFLAYAFLLLRGMLFAWVLGFATRHRKLGSAAAGLIGIDGKPFRRHLIFDFVGACLHA